LIDFRLLAMAQLHITINVLNDENVGNSGLGFYVKRKKKKKRSIHIGASRFQFSIDTLIDLALVRLSL
jgi:hypothetical protein